MCACPLTPNIVVSEECAVKLVSNAFVTSCCCYPVTSEEHFLIHSLSSFEVKDSRICPIFVAFLKNENKYLSVTKGMFR